MTKEEAAEQMHSLKECHVAQKKGYDAREIFLTFEDGCIFGGMLPDTVEVGY